MVPHVSHNHCNYFCRKSTDKRQWHRQETRDSDRGGGGGVARWIETDRHTVEPTDKQRERERGREMEGGGGRETERRGGGVDVCMGGCETGLSKNM